MIKVSGLVYLVWVNSILPHLHHSHNLLYGSHGWGSSRKMADLLSGFRCYLNKNSDPNFVHNNFYLGLKQTFDQIHYGA